MSFDYTLQVEDLYTFDYLDVIEALKEMEEENEKEI